MPNEPPDDNVVPIKPKRPGRGDPRAKGSGLPSAGDGWGGPAKGVGRDVSALKPGSYTTENIRKKAEREALWAAEAKEKMHTIMNTAEREETQLAAAAKLLEVLEGKPVARVITATVDLPDKLPTDPIEASKAYKQIMGGE